MFGLVYVSSAVDQFSSQQLGDLLATCRANNTALGITGMLLYKDGNFMQALEGEEALLRSLLAKIGRDPRHRGLLTLVQGPQETREFPDWSMGFRDLNAVAAQPIPGYSEFLNTPLTADAFASDLARCKRLLLTFKKNM